MRTRHHSECHRSRPRLVGRGRESPHSLGDGNRERQCAIHGYGRAGNILAKCLTFLAGADAAGIVLGAKVPVILTSRADSRITRLASCAVASLLAHARRSSLQAVKG